MTRVLPQAMRLPSKAARQQTPMPLPARKLFFLLLVHAQSRRAAKGAAKAGVQGALPLRAMLLEPWSSANKCRQERRRATAAGGRLAMMMGGVAAEACAQAAVMAEAKVLAAVAVAVTVVLVVTVSTGGGLVKASTQRIWRRCADARPRSSGPWNRNSGGRKSTASAPWRGSSPRSRPSSPRSNTGPPLFSTFPHVDAGVRMLCVHARARARAVAWRLRVCPTEGNERGDRIPGG